jgi:hypothetical protein
MKIVCDTMMDFNIVIIDLVKSGITFEATTRNLTIICTGGF